jgi:hypothetical protein
MNLAWFNRRDFATNAQSAPGGARRPHQPSSFRFPAAVADDLAPSLLSGLQRTKAADFRIAPEDMPLSIRRDVLGKAFDRLVRTRRGI